jgi:hypothetical protein
MHILISNRAGTSEISRLLENESAPFKFTDLSFESVIPGGWTVASFKVPRPIRVWYDDMQTFNRIVIGEGPFVFWEGYIDKVDRGINPDVFNVGCLGWSSIFNQQGTTADITVVAATDHMSEFIINVLLADANITSLISNSTANIGTTDYDYPDNTRFEFSPYTTYFDALDKLNSGNNWQWGVWKDRVMSFNAKPTTPTWLAKTSDCSDLKIGGNPANYANRIICSYTQDSVHQQSVTVNDTTSQTDYGRIVVKTLTIPGRITTAGATAMANVYLTEMATLKVSAEFTTSKIYDIYGTEHHLGEVKAGEVVRITDWLPTEEISGVDNIATFEIKSPKYDHNSSSLAITPTEFVSQVEVSMARIEATGY